MYILLTLLISRTNSVVRLLWSVALLLLNPNNNAIFIFWSAICKKRKKRKKRNKII